MDIFISSEGKEIGPFSEETAQTLMDQGTVAATDLAWRSGMDDWAPLGEMLALRKKPDPSGEIPAGATASPPPADAKPPIESATAKQKAFLAYLTIAIPDDLSKEHASTLLNDAMENPALAEQIGKWSAERLRLHPDLFADEVHARKENRANHFFDICQTEGAQYFTRITKAHCQVLVGFLDVKFPTWDSRMEDAATNYFFPAIAEKFPQLVERQWKDRFHYAEGHGSESATTATRVRKRHVTPPEAILRGIALGLAVLAALYFGQKMIPRWMARHPAEKEQAENPPPPPKVASAGRADLAGPAVSSLPEPKRKRDKTAKKNRAAAANNVAAPPSTPAAAEDSTDAPANPKAAAQSPEKAPSDPSMSTSPTASSGNPAPSPAPPAAPPSHEPAAPSKSNLVLTKPVELQLAYGKVKLSVGTAVKLISRDGASLKVNYLNTVIVVPASSTDIDSPASESGASSSSPASAPAPATNRSGDS